MSSRWPIVLLLLLLTGCSTLPKINQSPSAAPGFPLIAPGYFVCGQCGSLDGGIYGKGPTKELRTPEGETCVHDWVPIARSEFREVAAERFGIDWTQEIPFWSGAEGAAAVPKDATQPVQDNPRAAD